MFGFFKKKKKDKQIDAVGRDKNQINTELRKSIDEEIDKEKKRNKKKKSKEEPNTPALITLALSLVIGAFFWAYGKIAQEGVNGLLSSITLPSFSAPSLPSTEFNDSGPEATLRPWTESNDVIIFEK